MDGVGAPLLHAGAVDVLARMLQFDISLEDTVSPSKAVSSERR